MFFQLFFNAFMMIWYFLSVNWLVGLGCVCVCVFLKSVCEFLIDAAMNVLKMIYGFSIVGIGCVVGFGDL